MSVVEGDIFYLAKEFREAGERTSSFVEIRTVVFIEGMRCQISHLRSLENIGNERWFCGYVMIPEGHELYNADYMEIKGLDVYRGLTFSQRQTYEEIGVHGTMKRASYNKIGFDTNTWNNDPLEKNQSFICEELKKLVQQINLKSYTIEKKYPLEDRKICH